MANLKLSLLACAVVASPLFASGTLTVVKTINDSTAVQFNDANAIINPGTPAPNNAHIVANHTNLKSHISAFNSSKIEIKNSSTADFALGMRAVNSDFTINNSNASFNNSASFLGGSVIVANHSGLNSSSDMIFDKTFMLKIQDNSSVKIDGKFRRFNSASSQFEERVLELYLLNNSSLEAISDFEINKTLLDMSNSSIKIGNNLSLNTSGDVKIQNGSLVNKENMGIYMHSSKADISQALYQEFSSIIIENSTINAKTIKATVGVTSLSNNSVLNITNEAELSGSMLILNSSNAKISNLKMKNYKGYYNEIYRSDLVLENGSNLQINGDFENEGSILFGVDGAQASKINAAGTITLKDTTEIGIYSPSNSMVEFSNLTLIQAANIQNQIKNENIYAMYYDPKSIDKTGLVKYDPSIITATATLSDDKKRLIFSVGMSQDMQNKSANEKIDFLAKSAKDSGVNLSTQDLEIISSLFGIGDSKGNGAVATEGIKLAAQAAAGNKEAAQIIAKTTQTIKKNSQDSINANSNLISTFNSATKSEVGKRISNITTRSNISQLASFINSLEGQQFADASNGVLLSMMADEMAEYNNSFYINALGAKGDFKDGTNPEIYGAILGYDRTIDDLLIGGYFSYTNSETENIKLDSNVYELGLYSRYFLDNNEFGFNIAGGYGKNDLSYNQNIFGANKFLQSKYDSAYISLGLDYGYRFAINDTSSIKPYIGADYLYLKTENYTLKDETGADFQKMQSNTAKNLKAKFGLEGVKKFDDIAIYADAKIKQDLTKDDGITKSSFVGSSSGFIIKGSDKKHTNFAIDTGIAYNATKNLSLNLNLGADVNSDDKIYSTSFGVGYRF